MLGAATLAWPSRLPEALRRTTGVGSHRHHCGCAAEDMARRSDMPRRWPGPEPARKPGARDSVASPHPAHDARGPHRNEGCAVRGPGSAADRLGGANLRALRMSQRTPRALPRPCPAPTACLVTPHHLDPRTHCRAGCWLLNPRPAVRGRRGGPEPAAGTATTLPRELRAALSARAGQCGRPTLHSSSAETDFRMPPAPVRPSIDCTHQHPLPAPLHLLVSWATPSIPSNTQLAAASDGRRAPGSLPAVECPELPRPPPPPPSLRRQRSIRDPGLLGVAGGALASSQWFAVARSDGGVPGDREDRGARLDRGTTSTRAEDFTRRA